MKKRIAIASGLAALIIGGALATTQFLSPASSGPGLQEMLDQPPAVMTLHLYPAPAADSKDKNVLSSGYDVNSADGKTKVLTHNEYVSGIEENVYYRADGSKSWSRDYYPQPADGSPAVQRSVAWFSPDGKSYVAHEVKRENGLWERHGELLADGNYQQTYYCKDGRTIEKQQLFNASKRFVKESAIFCETGKNVRSVTEGESGKKMLTLFNVAGKPTLSISQHFNYDSVEYDGDKFDERGAVTIHFSRVNGMHGSSLDLTSMKNGNPAVEWIGYDGYSLRVIAYDSGDAQKRMRFEQKFKSSGYPNYKNTLQTVTEYASDGKTVLRTIEFNADGSPGTITLPGKTEGTSLIYTLDQQGSTVVKSVLHDNNKNEDQEQALPTDTTVKIPEEFTRLQKQPDEPKWDDGKTDVGNQLYDFF